MLPKKELVMFFEWFIALSMVLNCASVYLSAPNSQWLSRTIILFFCVSMLCLCLLSKNKKIMHAKKIILYNIILVGFLMIHAVMRPYNVIGNICFIIEISLLVNYIFLEGKIGISNILKKYKSLILVLSIMSLFFWVFGSILNFIEPTGQLYSNWTSEIEYAVYKGYFGLHFETQTNDMFDDSGLIRNTSIFTEAPMYSLHISLALLVELFIERKTSKINVLLLIITILSTMSSTGYAIIALAIYFKGNIWLKQHGHFRILRLIINVVFLLLISYIIHQIFDYRSNTVSGLIRFDDYLVALDTWLSSPVFGVGVYNLDAMRQHMEAWRSFNTGYSNSIGIVLAQGGAWLFVPFMYLFYKAIVVAYSKKRYNFLVSTLLFFYLTIFAVAIYSFNMLGFMTYIIAEINSD